MKMFLISCRGNMATYGTNDFMMAVANTTGRDHNQTQFRVIMVALSLERVNS